MTDITVIETATGERLYLQPALDEAIEVAIDQSCVPDDPAESRALFGRRLVEGLHDRGFILVARAGGDKGRAAVDADLYSLALAAKHEAEERLGWLRQLILGSATLAGAEPLVELLGQVVLQLAGRAPITDVRPRAELAILRLRGAAGILAGARDLADLPPFSAPLAAFFREV